jgi:hypothetical protein
VRALDSTAFAPACLLAAQRPQPCKNCGAQPQNLAQPDLVREVIDMLTTLPRTAAERAEWASIRRANPPLPVIRRIMKCRARGACENCGREGVQLDAHHERYFGATLDQHPFAMKPPTAA